MREVLGDFFFFFEIPYSHALILCVRTLRYGVMGTRKVTSLCVLSLGRDYGLLLGCVASPHSYYSRCWSSVYTSLTNTTHTQGIV